MILTRLDTAATIDLPSDLFWEDQYLPRHVQAIETSITGAALIQSATKLWLPMTLRPWADDASWIDQTTLNTLLVWADDPALTFSIEINSRTYSPLKFRVTGDELPVAPEPVAFEVDSTGAARWYRVTLRFLRLDLSS